MRLVLSMALLALLLSGCGRSDGDNLKTINAKDAELGKVKSMVIRGGCMGCHDTEQHRFGPAWKAVSQRYKDNPDAVTQLTESIKYGSAGKWSDVSNNNVMPANNLKVNDAEIAQLVEYILSL